MSETFAEIVEIEEVGPHPNADRLAVARVKGTQTVVGLADFKAGDRAVFFPPGLLISEAVAERLNVKKYLKHAMYKGFKAQCRVAACRLRGEPSYGFLIPQGDTPGAVGDCVNDLFEAVKYEPPIKYLPGDCREPVPQFHQYTSIEHYWRYPGIIAEGDAVRVTEKIHGTNSRVGLIWVDGQYEFMGGSHRTNRKQFDTAGRPSIYWQPLAIPAVLDLLTELCNERHNVVLFGEIFGSGVQDMDYGAADATGYRVFDATVDGRYLDWRELDDACGNAGVEMVPLLYIGAFSAAKLKELTDGPTAVADAAAIRGPFKRREGCVVTPLVERFNAVCGGRVVFKSVSVDYLDRKGAEDNDDLGTAPAPLALAV